MSDDSQWISDTCDKLRALFASMPDIELRPHPMPLFYDPDARLLHCIFDVRARDGDATGATERCLEAVCRALEIVASGRLAFIRTAPEVNADHDFRANRQNVQGYVRFSASPDEGAWNYAARVGPAVIYSGFPT
jgi:hypothetical protein